MRVNRLSQARGAADAACPERSRRVRRGTGTVHGGSTRNATPRTRRPGPHVLPRDCTPAQDSTQCSTDMNKTISILAWSAVALTGAAAVGVIAVRRGEPINALWLVTAATCCYALGYRFYSKFISAKILALDALRATPAERLENGRDFLVTNKWVVFGHHFAAISGPGPLVGPVLAAQFGYLPGTLWILAGAVMGGCVQDMVIMFCSTRRDGRSLGQMARDELGPVGGWAAMIGTMLIMLILIAVLGLVIVNAMKHSPWATATVLG